jgi:hypothetical protein
MTIVPRRCFRIALVAVAAAVCLLSNERVSLVATLSGAQSLVSEAHAIIGRPLTPMSYAGVARRTVRRGVYY